MTTPRALTCRECGQQLLGRGWLEHHADGSHTWHPPADQVGLEWALLFVLLAAVGLLAALLQLSGG